MSQRNTIVRSMHDLGLAAWFGGGLMGVLGLNGGAAKAKDPTERLRISSIGWARWAPVQLVAIGVHGIGGIGLVLTNKGRLFGQSEARGNGIIKTVVTVAAGAASVGAGLAGSRILKHSDEGAPGVTEPDASTSKPLAAAQITEKVLQWSIPILTGIIIVLSAQQGELQRPLAGWAENLTNNVKRTLRR